MSLTRTGSTPLAISLNAHAKKAHIFDGLHSESLIYLVKLCDNDCISILEKNEINIIKGKAHIIKGHRNKTYGLWDIPISIPVRHRALAITTRDTTKIEPIQYLHVCCFSPTPRTFLKAINSGNLITLTGLNDKKLLNHLPPNIEKNLGHMDQERKNLQSTKH